MNIQDIILFARGWLVTKHLGGLLHGVLVGAARRRIFEQFHGTRGSNILYLDGHAGYRDAKQIKTDLFRQKKP